MKRVTVHGHNLPKGIKGVLYGPSGELISHDLSLPARYFEKPAQDRAKALRGESTEKPREKVKEPTILFDHSGKPIIKNIISASPEEFQAVVRQATDLFIDHNPRVIREYKLMYAMLQSRGIALRRELKNESHDYLKIERMRDQLADHERKMGVLAEFFDTLFEPETGPKTRMILAAQKELLAKTRSGHRIITLENEGRKLGHGKKIMDQHGNEIRNIE